MSLVLFGVGSPLIVEYEETCLRLGIAVVAGVRNRAGDVFLSAGFQLLDVGEIDAAVLGMPCLCPLFTPGNRQVACREAERSGFSFAPALVDPNAVVARSSEIGEGSYVNAGAVVGAGARIGRHVVINRLAGIGHHARIGDFVSIGPGATLCGQVEIGDGALIGAGATILPKVRIGAGGVVPAGKVVGSDVIGHEFARPFGR